MKKLCEECKKVTMFFRMKMRSHMKSHVIYCDECNHAVNVNTHEAHWYDEDNGGD